jgi:hypothetical protein
MGFWSSLCVSQYRKVLRLSKHAQNDQDRLLKQIAVLKEQIKDLNKTNDRIIILNIFAGTVLCGSMLYSACAILERKS